MTIDVGTPLDDTLTGGPGDDLIRGLAGNDLIYGGAGHDSLFGGNGDDTIHGGDGDDVIYTGPGANTAYGGAGDDLISYVTGPAQTLDGGEGLDTLRVTVGGPPLYFVVDADAGTADDGQLSTLTGFERFIAIGGAGADFVALGHGDDIFQGGAGRDTAFGGAGNDLLVGGAGNDRLFGEQGHDTLQGGGGRDLLLGQRGDDMLFGGWGDDRLFGGRGQDVLYGGEGNDTLIGGPGNDTLTGGAGADVFLFSPPENGFDLITDFETGVDQIRYWHAQLYSRVESIYLPVGQLDPSRLAFGAADSPQAQLVLIYHAQQDETWLHWDDNGNDPSGGTYGLMRFSGDIQIAASDIFLY